MLGTYSDEFGKLDFERSQHGSGMSNRSQAKRFVSALNSIAERTYNNLFDLQQLRHLARELQIRVSSASSPSSSHRLPHHPQLPLQRERSKGTLLCLLAIAARTNALPLGWAEFLKCWFQCFTPSASPEDTPNFVPKFRVVSVLYFSSAMMFLCDLLWIKYAFQVFIPASDILKLYIERNII